MIAKADLQDLYPLSPMQQGMLFHALLDPDSRAYFEQVSYRVGGRLDRASFEEAWNTLFRRHAVLRTVFAHEKTRRPLQLVLKERRPEMRYEDLRRLGEAERQAVVEQRREEDRQRGFDLTQDVLMRFSILQLGEATHEIIWSMHHILLDGWCMGVLQNEFMQIYETLRSGGQPNLPPTAPYSRYIQWLEGRDQAGSLAYWQTALEGYAQQASFSRNRASSASYRHRVFHCELGQPLVGRLKSLSAACQVTLSTVLQGLWGVLLGRYNDTEDVVFGAVVSGRPADLPEVERMLGLFINAAPVRVRFDGREPCRTMLRRLQKEWLDSEAHQYCPLHEIQNRSPLKQDLLDHLLVIENYPIEQRFQGSQAGLTVEGVERFEQTHYDLVLVIAPGGTIRLEFQYNAERFDEAWIKRLAAQYAQILKSVAANGAGPIDEITLMSADERMRVVHELNAGATARPPAGCIHELFAEQAARRPEAVAVVYGDQALSYGELNARANRLAHCLRERGVGAEAPVGVCLERSLNLVVGLLGILKAGGAYVALDPAWPSGRQNQLLAASGAPWALCDSARQPALSAGPSQALNLDTLALAGYAAENPQAFGKANQLAYLSFTSGSTGQPKGVAIPHRAVARLVRETDYMRFGPEQRFLHLAPLAFDASTWEIWGSLLNGARLIIAPPPPLSLGELGALLRRQEITALWLTAGLFHLMVEEHLADLAGLQYLLAGGDVLNVGAVRAVLQAHPDCTLINGYGPTENTTFSCCHALRADQPPTDTVPIGKPIAHSRAYVLDRRQRPAPIGVPGELYLGGAGLARGYLGQPALTAERFVPDPISGIPGARLYRSGDRVRWRPDGRLEFLGRYDYQVKIRGYRIEPGEIEARLLQHVREALVVVRGENAERHLVAYVIPRQPSLSIPDLRAALQGQLPEYLIPQAFVVLDAWPLNANGKIDRRALPEPDPAGSEDDAPPTTATEQALAEIWAEVLQIGRAIARHDHFFELGGHSLSATQVASRLRARFQVEIPLKTLFETPMLARLAERVDEAKASGGPPAAQPALTRQPRRAPVRSPLPR
ncbi:MAG: amino acid adenylation domain-containing protein [Gammaproteobacteria bacterium]|nr:amino acid adenylation domain-containing protein [Gammaproteobacteria bacterium]